MTPLTPDQVRTLARIRLDAITARPYYAAAVFALQPVSVPGLGTLAVDADGRLYVDFDTLASWDPDERAGVLVHETSHLLHRHHDRARRYGAALEPRRWNIAADAEINDGIGLRLPEGAVTPDRLGLQPHKLAEHYYAEITDTTGYELSCGSCAGGGRRPWEQASGAPGLDPLEIDAVREKVAAAVRGAPPGTVAAGDQRWVDTTRDAAVDWRRQLRGALVGTGRRTGTSQWTYARPPRRRPPGPGPALPSTYTPKSTVAVVIDTSGSVADDDLASIASEVGALCRAIPGCDVHLFSCDTQATYHGRMQSPRSLRLSGGGGTDMVAGIDAALALRPRPDHVVVATDGQTPWPTARPRRTDVIALLVGADCTSEPPSWIRCVRADAAAAVESRRSVPW